METPFSVTLLGGRKFEVTASKGSGLDKYDVAYFTACCDTVETTTRYAKALKLDYPILSDPGGKTAKAYGNYNGRFSGRTTFYIDKEGKIAYIDKEVKTSTHGADIAARLENLGVSKK